MQIEVMRSELQNALVTLTPIASNKTCLPILNQLLFYVNSDKVFITATNLEVGARVKISAIVTESGSFTLLANKLSEIVSNLPNEIVVFTQADSIVTIKSGTASFKLQTLEVSDFPNFVDIDVNESKEFATETLLKAFNNVLYAASTDESRFNLNSLCFTNYNELPCAIATDGHRLALQYFIDSPFLKGTLVPVQGCEIIKKWLSRVILTNPNVSLNYDTNNIIVATEDTMIVVRIIAGEYPNTTKVIPTNTPEAVILVNTEQFRAMTKRVSLVNDHAHKSITLIVKDNVELLAATPLGMANDSIENMGKTGANFECLLNSKYLLEVINTIKSDTCEIQFMGEGKPLIFSLPRNTESSIDFFGMVMPMRK